MTRPFAESERPRLPVQITSHSPIELLHADWVTDLVMRGMAPSTEQVDFASWVKILYGPNENDAKDGLIRDIFVAESSGKVTGALTVTVTPPDVTFAKIYGDEGPNGFYNRIRRTDPDYATSIAPLIGNTLFVNSIATFPEYRNQSVSTQLLEAATRKYDPGFFTGRSLRVPQVIARQTAARHTGMHFFYGGFGLTEGSEKYTEHAKFFNQMHRLWYALVPHEMQMPQFPGVMFGARWEFNPPPNIDLSMYPADIQAACTDLAAAQQFVDQVGLPYAAIKGTLTVHSRILEAAVPTKFLPN